MLDPVPFAQSEPISVLAHWEYIICQPLIVSPQTIALDAIALMSDRSSVGATMPTGELASGDRATVLTSCIVIVEHERPIGILTATDIVRSIALGRDLAQLAIRDLMRSPVVTLRESAITDTDVAVATDILDRERIRHLPLVDDRERLVGIVTSDRLHRHLAVVAANVIQLETTKISLPAGQVPAVAATGRSRSLNRSNFSKQSSKPSHWQYFGRIENRVI
jgi:CBS domain-containing protein